MNSTLGTSSPWALFTSLLVLIVCLPLLSGSTYHWQKLQTLKSEHKQTEHMLLEHKRVERSIKEKLRKKNKVTTTAPTVLNSLLPLGSALGNDISLLTLDASLDKQNIRLTFAAKSLPALFYFTERLQRIPLQVELQSHKVDENKMQEWPIRATVNINLSVKDVQ